MNLLWLQQDGYSYSAHDRHVDELFPCHIILRYVDVAGPARSPDLSACDFWLWGYLKSKVYARNPQSISDLKNIIVSEISAVPKSIIRLVFASLQKRLDSCVDIGGGR